MARKPMFQGGTKNRIIEVGSKLFFENGYDGTSIRAIMREVGGEIGVFYYYYKTKDDLFTDVLENFFEPYKKNFALIAESAKTEPERSLFRFFTYMKKETREFRKKYEENMHRTVRWAIREQTLTVIEPYMEEIIKTLIGFGAKPKMNPRLTAVFLAHGVGSVILHEDAEWVEASTTEMRKTINTIMGLTEEESLKMFGE